MLATILSRLGIGGSVAVALGLVAALALARNAYLGAELTAVTARTEQYRAAIETQNRAIADLKAAAARESRDAELRARSAKQEPSPADGADLTEVNRWLGR